MNYYTYTSTNDNHLSVLYRPKRPRARQDPIRTRTRSTPSSSIALGRQSQVLRGPHLALGYGSDLWRRGKGGGLDWRHDEGMKGDIFGNTYDLATTRSRCSSRPYSGQPLQHRVPSPFAGAWQGPGYWLCPAHDTWNAAESGSRCLRARRRRPRSMTRKGKQGCWLRPSLRGRRYCWEREWVVQ